MDKANDSTAREIDASIEDLIAAASPSGDLGVNGTLALGRLRAGIRAAVDAEREACAAEVDGLVRSCDERIGELLRHGFDDQANGYGQTRAAYIVARDVIRARGAS